MKQVFDEKALEKFLLDIDCLNELSAWTSKFNIFDILKITRTEIRHSNMLAWLIDPNENHGLGDSFIKNLLQRLVEKDKKGRYNVFDVLLLNFYGFDVYREWNNIDLLLLSTEEKVLFAIENKIGFHEHSNQLNKYREILEEEYSDFKRFYIFLTPEGIAPSDVENWDVLNYTEVVDILDMVQGNKKIPADVALMIGNYIEVLRRDVVEDKKLIEICNKIYNKHKRALDLIYENRLTAKSLLTNVIRQVLQEYDEKGLIQYDRGSANKWILFHTKKMDELLPNLGANIGSWNSGAAYHYWIGEQTDNSFKAVFELGGVDLTPAHQPFVQRIIALEKPNDKKLEGFRYKRIHTKVYKIDEAEDIEVAYREAVVSAIEEILDWENELLKKLQ